VRRELLRYDGRTARTKKPKVTIGICGRNCSDIVGSAIDSIGQQDFPHPLMEILFVDDGSEDKTVNVAIKHLSRMDIASAILSVEWGGIGKARNVVIRNASGDYIIWVDSDEILSAGFVQEQIGTIERNPNAGIVTGKLSILEGETFVRALDLIPLVVEYSHQKWTDEAKLPGTGGATYRVAAVRQVLGFDEDLAGLGEDIDIANRIRKIGWRTIRGEGVFFERHGQLTTLLSSFRISLKQGVQSRLLYRRKSGFFSLYRMNPFASTVAGVFYAVRGYRITRKKIVLLLPLHFSLKMLVWFYGFHKG
jgi:glycosyltransferase involved in cell wall biosynthesis